MAGRVGEEGLGNEEGKGEVVGVRAGRVGMKSKSVPKCTTKTLLT